MKMKWDSPYRKYALSAVKRKKNQYSLMKRWLIGIEQMKPSFHTKKRLKEGGASGNAILSSRIHVSTVGRTEEKKTCSSLELYWASLINRQCAAACPCRKLWSAKWKIYKYQTLDLLETLTQKSLLSLILGNRIFKGDQVQKREREIIWKEKKRLENNLWRC